jgi:hypothetical protein
MQRPSGSAHEKITPSPGHTLLVLLIAQPRRGGGEDAAGD